MLKMKNSVYLLEVDGQWAYLVFRPGHLWALIGTFSIFSLMELGYIKVELYCPTSYLSMSLIAP